MAVAPKTGMMAKDRVVSSGERFHRKTDDDITPTDAFSNLSTQGNPSKVSQCIWSRVSNLIRPLM